MVSADEVIDPGIATITVGVRDMTCRLNNQGTSFGTEAEHLKRTAIVKMRREQLRETELV